jgi:hypothetical protein
MPIKRNFIIALAIGAIISAALLGIESRTDYAYLSWEGIGVAAAFLFWGVTGGPVFAGVAISWLVNAVVYGAPVFAVVCIVGGWKNLAAR